MELAEGDLPPAGVAEDHPGQGQAEEGDPADGLERLHQRTVTHGGAGAGVEEVHRHLGRVDLAQLAQQLQSLIVGLAQAEKDPAAQLHSCVTNQSAGVGPLLPGMGGHHRGEERPGRLQIVVVAVEAGVGQAPGLLSGEDAQAGRHLQTGPLADQGHGLDDPGQRPLVGTPEGHHDAELRRPQPGRLLGRGQQLVEVEERCGLHQGGEAGRLAAEPAVLRAGPGLGRDDPLDLHRGPAPGQADLMGQGGQRRQGLGRQGGQCRQLLGCQDAPLLEQGGGGGVQRIGRHRGNGSQWAQVDRAGDRWDGG